VELDGSVVLLVAGADVVVLMTAIDVMTLLAVDVVVGLGNAGRPVVIVILPWSSALQQTLKTTFMLWEEQRPPIRRCRSSLDDVEMK